MKPAKHRQKNGSKKKADFDLDAYIDKKMRDTEFRAAYDAENKRIDLILQIIELRQKRGMTQGDLAKAIGTQQSNISRLERFDYNFTVEMVGKIADALDATIRIELLPRRAKAA